MMDPNHTERQQFGEISAARATARTTGMDVQRSTPPAAALWELSRQKRQKRLIKYRQLPTPTPVSATRARVQNRLSYLLQRKNTPRQENSLTDEPDHHCSERPTAAAALGAGTSAQPHKRRHSPFPEISGPNRGGKPDHQHNVRQITYPATGSDAADAQRCIHARSPLPEITGPRRNAVAACANVQSSGATAVSRTAVPEAPHLQASGEDCVLPEAAGLELAEGNTTNAGERPFVCPDPRCGMAFTQWSTLSNHMKRPHGAQRAVKRKLMMAPEARRKMSESQQKRWIHHRQLSVGKSARTPSGRLTPDPNVLVNANTVTPAAVPQAAEVLYEVERILGMLKAGRTVWYLTKWKGFDSSHNSWKEASEMRRAWQSIKDFVLEFGKATAENSKILSPVGQAWLASKHPSP